MVNTDHVETVADVIVAEDGDILIVLGETGMDPFRRTDIDVDDGFLSIRQEDRVYASLDIDNNDVIGAIKNTKRITLVEVDDNGPIFHTNIVMAEQQYA